MQFDLIGALAHGCDSPRLTACGDPDQSIYSFLNGNAYNNFEVATLKSQVALRLAAARYVGTNEGKKIVGPHFPPLMDWDLPK